MISAEELQIGNLVPSSLSSDHKTYRLKIIKRTRSVSCVEIRWIGVIKALVDVNGETSTQK
jgi:hypothetical protein